jgi:uncharacterized protein YndB with AHSA1/START domain
LFNEYEQWKEKNMLTRLSDELGYAVEVTVLAPIERVFAALTTLDGLAGWWTQDTSGSPSSGGELTFGFGSDKAELMVKEVISPLLVVWKCARHSKFPEWQHTTLIFDMRAQDTSSTVVAFRHVGLVPTLNCYTLCTRGWDHYLDSLAASVEGKGGSPWGAQGQQAVRAAFDGEVRHNV